MYVSLSEKIRETPPADAELQVESLRTLFNELEHSIIDQSEYYDDIISRVASSADPGWIAIVGDHVLNDGEAVQPRNEDYAEGYTFHERAAELLGCWSNANPEALAIVIKLLNDREKCYLGIFAISHCLQCTDGKGLLESFRKTDFSEIKQLLKDPSLPTGILRELLYSVCQRLDRRNGNKDLQKLAIAHPNY